MRRCRAQKAVEEAGLSVVIAWLRAGKSTTYQVMKLDGLDSHG